MHTQSKSFDGKVNLFDTSSPEFIENPYRFYRERREVSPIIQILENTWSLTGLEEIDTVLASPKMGKMTPDLQDEAYRRIARENEIVRILRGWMLLKNPPEHKELRRPVQNVFTPRMVAGLRGVMEEILEELLEGISPGVEFDMVSAVSHPFPVSIITEMMGIPREDRGKFRRWSTDFAIALASDLTQLPEHLRARLNTSAREMIAYFRDLTREKRKNLSDDIVSLLLGQEGLSDELILSNCALILVAGHETTTSLISNGFNALFSNPEQLELLRSDPSLIPNAIEEFLRYDAPVQSVFRVVHEEFSHGGHEFRRGHMMNFVLGAAGRDPRANPDPDTLDVTRKEVRHLSFGKGIHYCLGANLAREEARMVFRNLIEGHPSLGAAGEAVRNGNWLLRGFAKLPAVAR